LKIHKGVKEGPNVPKFCRDTILYVLQIFTKFQIFKFNITRVMDKNVGVCRFVRYVGFEYFGRVSDFFQNFLQNF